MGVMETIPTRAVLLPLGPMARLLGVTSRWLRGEAEAGRIPHLPAGNTILFDADLVERLLAERARQPVPAMQGQRQAE
jgi:hypothetical protein